MSRTFACGKADLLYRDVHILYNLKLLNQLTDFNELVVPIEMSIFSTKYFEVIIY